MPAPNPYGRRVPGQELLEGVTVLDFTRVLAGPYCTRLLADLGARVIKIERPRGDDMRVAPLQLDPERCDQSTYFVRVNAGKRSIALDLGHADARAVAMDLVRVADVVVENFTPGVMARLGLDYAGGRGPAARPRLLLHLGIRPDGPVAGPPGVRPRRARDLGPDASAAGRGRAAAGLLPPGGRRARRHARVRRHRRRRSCAGRRTGRGAHLDVSMLEALVGAEDISFGSVLNDGPAYPGARAGMVVHEVGGEWVAFQVVGALDLWPRLVQLLGRPELPADPRFATPVARREHWPELRAIIADWLSRFTSAEDMLAMLRAARIPWARVLRPDEVVSAPHLLARQAFPAVAHPTRGSVRVTAPPFHVDGTPLAPAGSGALPARRAHAGGAGGAARLRARADRRAGASRRR